MIKTDLKTKIELDTLYDSIKAMAALMPFVARSPRYIREMKRAESLILEGFTFGQSLEIIMKEGMKANV